MTGDMEPVIRAWLGLLFGLSGIGAMTAVVTKFVRSAGGGLR